VEQQPSSRPSPPRRAPCAGKSASFPLPGLAQAAKPSTNLRPGWFTTAYFHRPDDLAAEIVAAGLTLSTLVGVEGAAWLLPGLPRLLADPAGRTHLLDLLRRTEGEPSLLGVSGHLLATAHP
jgi:hypothetical protein